MSTTNAETLSLGRATPGEMPGALPSAKSLWLGRVLSGLAVLFLLLDAGMKVLRLPVAIQALRDQQLRAVLPLRAAR